MVALMLRFQSKSLKLNRQEVILNYHQSIHINTYLLRRKQFYDVTMRHITCIHAITIYQPNANQVSVNRKEKQNHPKPW